MGKKSRRRGDRAPRSREWWHGGVRGLEVGDELIPPVKQPIMPIQYGSDMYQATDPHFVYLTSDRYLAEACAARHQNHDLVVGRAGGDLYLARPVGESIEDPDYDHVPGLSIASQKAVIVDVCARQVVMTDEIRLYPHRFMTWDDGSKMYDTDGHILPNDKMREVGLTPADFRSLGPRASHDAANQRANERLHERFQHK